MHACIKLIATARTHRDGVRPKPLYSGAAAIDASAMLRRIGIFGPNPFARETPRRLGKINPTDQQYLKS
jgi:hypothetical protein